MIAFKSGLYIVSTPIGNLSDITLRALETLKNSTIILCEDTRISRKLLVKHNIVTKLQIYNDQSDDNMRKSICKLLDQGEIISLISDAGTPLISDPGYKLVRELKRLGYYVDVVPGPSSPIAALTLSGLPTDRFLFAGFLPRTTIAKKNIFLELSNIDSTLIFFETANRLLDSLYIAKEVFFNPKVCVARELTKLYQEVKTGFVDEIIEYYQKNILKGEIVLIISTKNEDRTCDMQMIEGNLSRAIDSHFMHGDSARTIADKLYKDFAKFYTKANLYKIVNNKKPKL